MTAELIVMIFDKNEITRDVWQALGKTRAFRLESTALVERDASGKAFIQNCKHYPAWDAALDDSFLLFVAKALFTEDAKSHNRELMVAAFDECFIEEIEKAWLPHSSAWLVFISGESLVNTRRILGYLAEYSGTLVHTTIPERSIKSILELANSDGPQA